jgi:hypothetical protein
MIFRKVFNKKNNEALLSFSDDFIELVNPIKYYEDSFIVKQMILNGVPNKELNGKVEPSKNSKNIFIKSTILWNEILNDINKTILPKNLIRLLSTTKKSDQEKLLKGIEINPEILIAFIFKAYSNYGFKFSQYISEIPQKGVDLSKMPFAYEIKDNGQVKVYGKTELSDGQFKQAIQHRKVVVVKFLENKDIWHCFFTTFKSLRGEEIWLGKNQPHFHYLSNSFGISRERVIKELKSKKYKLGNLPHVKLTEFGNQPNK